MAQKKCQAASSAMKFKDDQPGTVICQDHLSSECYQVIWWLSMYVIYLLMHDGFAICHLFSQDPFVYLIYYLGSRSATYNLGTRKNPTFPGGFKTEPPNMRLRHGRHWSGCLANWINKRGLVSKGFDVLSLYLDMSYWIHIKKYYA